MNRHIEKIKNSKKYMQEKKRLDRKGIDYDIRHGYNWVKLVTNWHDYLFYVSKQNQNHIFRTEIFQKDKINSRLISSTPRNLTSKKWHDRDVICHRDEKIIFFRNTDLGDTSNIARWETVNRTLGHPFRRKMGYRVKTGLKDELQYQEEAKELFSIDKDGKRKKLLDDTFVSRVYRLYLRFKYRNKNIPNYRLRNKMQKMKTITGKGCLDKLEYLLDAIKSYHPFFFRKNGMCKLNIKWLETIIHHIGEEAILYKPYLLIKVNRKKAIGRTTIQNKVTDINKWREQRIELLKQKYKNNYISKEEYEHSKRILEERIEASE